MAQDEYDPEIQSVIDRFVRGDISLRSKKSRDTREPKMPKVSTTGWADSHEEAVEKVKKTRRAKANYYERLENRGTNKKGDLDDDE